MFTLVMLALTPNLPPVGYGVSLEDAKAFPIDGLTANRMWQLAANHKSVMQTTVEMNNPPEVVAAWHAETRWRYWVWYHLDDVIYRTHLPNYKRLHALAELKELLGPELYHAGYCPAPIPTYKPD